MGRCSARTRGRTGGRGGEDRTVASGERVDRGQRPRARTANVVIPFPRRAQAGRLDLARLAPSARSLLIAFALLAGATAAYVGARETSVFAVDKILVRGASPAIASEVERALAASRGTSLLAVDLAESHAAVVALPTIAAARFDRAFPHTLAVTVVAERPVAVIRQGADAFVVSARGRIIRRVERGALPSLARIWVPRTVGVLALGTTVTDDVRTAVTAVSPLAGRRFPSRVVSVSATPEELTLRLRSGLEIRLGDATDVQLKLLVARRVMPRLQPGSRYLDVSVPDRPVAGLQ